MKPEKDIRWKQRFSNFQKALGALSDAVELSYERNLTDLEKQGMIQGFEFTHELCWKTMKDFIMDRGNESIFGSKDAVREAFKLGLINDGELWMKMIESRNLSSHTYNNEIANNIVDSIVGIYFKLFQDFNEVMENHLDEL